MGRSYIWLQTLGTGRGDQIAPGAVPSARIAAAEAMITAALAADDGAPIPLREQPGATLQAVRDRRQLVVTIAINGDPVVTLGIAPRDRDGAKLWPRLVALAERVGLEPTPTRPREPWAVAVPYAALFCHLTSVDWLPPLEAELACAWIDLV